MELPVSGDENAVLRDGQCDIETVVDAAIERRGQIERRRQQNIRRIDLDRYFAECFEYFAGLVTLDLAAAHLLPEGVSDLGTDQVGSAEHDLRLEQAHRRRGMDLGDEPLDRDAGVD